MVPRQGFSNVSDIGHKINFIPTVRRVWLDILNI